MLLQGEFGMLASKQVRVALGPPVAHEGGADKVQVAGDADTRFKFQGARLKIKGLMGQGAQSIIVSALIASPVWFAATRLRGAP